MGKLILQREENGPKKEYQLSSNELGQGGFGIVYAVIDVTNSLAAKWFWIKDQGDIEIKNLDAIKEAIDWGVHLDPPYSALWVIMKRKFGVLLKDLPEYKKAIESKAECEKFMYLVREKTAESCRQYLKMDGAPMHEFVVSSELSFVYFYLPPIQRPKRRKRAIQRQERGATCGTG